MSQLTSYFNRFLFVVALLIAVLAVWEKLSNMLGYTVLRGVFSPGRLLEFGAIAILFVIALLLREIRNALVSKGPS